MKLDPSLTIVFGTLSVVAAIAAIRYKKSVGSLLMRIIRRRGRRGIHSSARDIEAQPGLATNGNTRSTGIELQLLPPVALRPLPSVAHPTTYLDPVPSPYEETAHVQTVWRI
ncbi:uncharacterized protein BDZ99DRAFT_137626 [Mytilinidion resinicola]|uniref:Uncharacterized protein n=1 Tax=Mytilinidion resinicola TaxID=574789 RepID=A0A6A6Z8A1_9PEZI|nr:uncharacterized protein BDZ99DRAFT_137626 [Mytilinidion resinicola]KAF2816505.1 hypothetical protein BDZ99DRAFT_137626 [Mytilinidion resinicola]